MKRLDVRPQARLGLLEIWHHIAADNVNAANRMVDKIEAAVRGLAVMPGKGHTRRDVRDPRFRFWPVRPYVIAYSFDDEALTITRVVDGRRNFKRLFKRP